METHRNVLVIAYYFPPMGLSGVQRTLKFVKYLPQFGWQPTVLTVTPTGYYAQDYTLLEEIHPLHIDVERVGSLDPNWLFRKKGVVKMPSERMRKILTFFSDSLFIPDNKIGWKRQAVKAAEKLFEKKKFDIIFATAPPFTDFLIGAELAEKFRKPLVIDYRDVWHEYPYKYYPTPLHRWMNARLEKKVLHRASRIITTNRRVKELILIRYKFLEYNDVIIIPQGFDPGDFRSNAAAIQKSNKMRLTHAGVFYGDRSPIYFLQALKQVFSDAPYLKDRIEACFVGNFHESDMKLVRLMGLEGNVTVTGYLDHAHCVQYLQSSDVLWFMVNNDRQSPGKLYEYLGARKPVLACVPSRGFVRQTLQEARGTIIVEPTDAKGIASAILQFYEQYAQKKLPQPKADVIEKYNRIELTRELSKIFGFLTE
ncbi:MAG: glycosyltransferase [Ignavibacteriae bacterium]|nr:glycosyltransferase [Ignavibacteria bacterium]MBI3363427.1 glycosyltransferase [Ignavibacteriota bacterium]